MKVSEKDIKAYVLKVLSMKAEKLGLSARHFGEDVNIFDVGIVDSLGFIDLVGQVEKAFGVEIDFETRDPSEFATVSGFAKCFKKTGTGT
jgi:acyl carrier protein